MSTLTARDLMTTELVTVPPLPNARTSVPATIAMFTPLQVETARHSRPRHPSGRRRQRQ